ncbi:hypothetical protein DV735_g5019, partial [Chaetothyriales sp. CBS 134920]
MHPHPVKRRKIDPLHSSLSKPFRSPLRSRNTDAACRLQTCAAADTLGRPAASGAGNAAALVPRPEADAATSQQRALPPDSLQKQYTARARQLTLLRQSLDTAQQALKIQSTHQAADLDQLIAKWKLVVRDTAEELFEDAKQRMDSRPERTADRPDVWVDDREDQLTDAQRRMLEIQRADDQAEADRYGLIEKRPDTEDVDTSFTLDKMLLQMNCDLDLVGYDREEQRWLD